MTVCSILPTAQTETCDCMTSNPLLHLVIPFSFSPQSGRSAQLSKTGISSASPTVLTVVCIAFVFKVPSIKGMFICLSRLFAFRTSTLPLGPTLLLYVLLPLSLSCLQQIQNVWSLV